MICEGYHFRHQQSSTQRELLCLPSCELNVCTSARGQQYQFGEGQYQYQYLQRARVNTQYQYQYSELLEVNTQYQYQYLVFKKFNTNPNPNTLI